MWKIIETEAGKIRVAKTKRKRGKRRSRKEKRRKSRKTKEKKQKKERTTEVKKVAEEQKIWDEEEEAAKLEAEAKKLVPEKFHRQIKVFGKKQSERMRTRKIWDHAINMKKEFVPRKGKVYLLSREEREEVCKFIQEQLRKGYIRPSKLLQMVLVFFIGKKDDKKKMVQNYRYLNKQTIKNNYPLPLISDVVKNIGTKKVFTKIDLRQSYNNVWIKEGDK